MRAVVIHDFHEWSVEDVPRPEPGPGEVLIEVDRAQLSVTECRLFRGHDIAHYDSVERQLREGSARLFGHEFSGRVIEVGDAVEAFAPGDRVYPPGKIPCGECGYCRSGFERFCREKTQIGYHRPGGLSEYVVQPAEPLCALPQSVSGAEGAALQPLASAVLCVEDAGISTGDTVVVVGAGVMGLNCAQVALAMGADRVFAVDPVAGKREVAADRGLRPIDPRDGDPTDRILDATGGVGADVVFEAVGAEQSHGNAGDDPLAQALSAVRAGGTVVQVGHITGEITLRPRAFREKNVDWINPSVGVAAFTPNADTGRLAADLVADGRVSIAETITHELSGLESFERAVDVTLDDETGFGPAQLVIGG